MRLTLSCLLVAYAAGGTDLPANYVAAPLIELNDNGAWSWFMDERAIVHDGKLIVGSVRAVGDYRNDTASGWGNVEIAVYDLASGATQRTVLHRHLEQDDHDNPAFLALPDGRYLAVYTRHGVERRIYYRFSEPRNPLVWGPASTFDTPGDSARPLRGNNVTYSNLFRLSSGRILNFFRGVDLDPNYMYSDDSGRTWRYGGRLAHGRDGYSPYLKYAFDGRSTIHFVMTEDHPRNFANSVYHGFVRDGSVFLSSGARRGRLSETTRVDLNAWDLTRVFRGDSDHVAWVIDLELDAERRPYVVFSVQRDGRGLPRGQGGMDHRFHYGRWDGSAWRVHEIAYAGTRLYPGEDDYTGLAALDPNDPDIVYISTDADPVSGAPLVSRADGQRHRELFRGRTRDAGATWTWEPITANSGMDNLRPIVPKWRDPRTALVWMRGTYRNNHGEWTTAVVATILSRGDSGGALGVAPEDLVRIERPRVLAAAARYLTAAPVTITAFPAARSAGGLHDFYSEGDYWWPDPQHPDGPYIRRDGETNPDNFVAHRDAMRRLSQIVPALVAAYRITGDERYARQAAAHLRAWFVDEGTRMNPNLLNGQAIKGVATGRGTGLIDTIHLVEVARATWLLERTGYLKGETLAGIKDWFRHYLEWITTHPFGMVERSSGNNHAAAWALQVAAFAQLVGDDDQLASMRRFFRDTLISGQMAADGSFPRELGRTKPYGYSLFQLDVMAMVAEALSTPRENLWTFMMPDGRGMRRALEFMYPFIEDKATWPKPPDVMYHDAWPIRHPALFFGGRALHDPRYVALWQTLNPDPTVDEVIRNYPVRQPLLWAF